MPNYEMGFQNPSQAEKKSGKKPGMIAKPAFDDKGYQLTQSEIEEAKRKRDGGYDAWREQE